MRIAVSSVVTFDVPDGESIETIARKFHDANAAYVGRPMETITGQRWTMVKIDAFAVRADDGRFWQMVRES